MPAPDDALHGRMHPLDSPDLVDSVSGDTLPGDWDPYLVEVVTGMAQRTAADPVKRVRGSRRIVSRRTLLLRNQTRWQR